MGSLASASVDIPPPPGIARRFNGWQAVHTRRSAQRKSRRVRHSYEGPSRSGLIMIIESNDQPHDQVLLQHKSFPYIGLLRSESRALINTRASGRHFLIIQSSETSWRSSPRLLVGGRADGFLNLNSGIDSQALASRKQLRDWRGSLHRQRLNPPVGEADHQLIAEPDQRGGILRQALLRAQFSGRVHDTQCAAPVGDGQVFAARRY